MFTQPRMIRCKRCKRVFSDYADHCPECHTKSPRGWVGFIVPILCVLIAIAAFLAKYWVFQYLPIGVGITGIMCLFYGALLMLRETRMAASTIKSEMDFTWELARKVAPRDVISKYTPKGKNKGMKTAKINSGRKIPDTLSGE